MSREHEARIWDQTPGPAVSVDFGSLPCPTKVIRSDPALEPDRPKFDPRDAAGAEHEILPGTTHFLQLEKPEECVAATLEFLARQGIVESKPARPKPVEGQLSGGAETQPLPSGPAA